MAEIIVQQVALVSETSSVDFSDVATVAAALQKQVTRDFTPIWNINATVSAFAKLEDVPLGYWPIIIKSGIGAGGVHLDKDGQPYALVGTSSEWSVTASHECLEMLCDPFGNRLVAGDSPNPVQGRVEFLVEVCDPSEASEFGYSVNGVKVSDFYTPRYFDPVVAHGVRYSFMGAIQEPRDVLRGGYLSWHEPISDDWWQEHWFSGSHSVFENLGPLTIANGSIRSQIDRITNEKSQQAMLAATDVRRGLSASTIERATNAKANFWREEIESVGKEGVGTAFSDSAEETPARAPARRGARRAVTESRGEAGQPTHRRRPPGYR